MKWRWRRVFPRVLPCASPCHTISHPALLPPASSSVIICSHPVPSAYSSPSAFQAIAYLHAFPLHCHENVTYLTPRFTPIHFSEPPISMLNFAECEHWGSSSARLA